MAKDDKIEPWHYQTQAIDPEDKRYQRYFNHCYGCMFIKRLGKYDLWAHWHLPVGRLTIKLRYGAGKSDFKSWGGVHPCPDDADLAQGWHEFLSYCNNQGWQSRVELTGRVPKKERRAWKYMDVKSDD